MKGNKHAQRIASSTKGGGVMTEYCYSTDEENFQHESMGDLLDYLDGETDDKIGAAYWKGEKVALSHADCIDVDSFLEVCDERAYEEIGEVYDNCFADVDDDEKAELKALIVEWAKKHVNIRYWRVLNVQELKITAEDLE
jgi:hypothetical protein